MGLILDSSVLIAAERASQTVTDLLEQTLQARGDQEVALASVSLVELHSGSAEPILRSAGTDAKSLSRSC